MNAIVTLVWIGPKVPTKKNFLVKGVNGVLRESTLCTTQGRAEEIIAKYLDKLDPFVRNGLPIAWTDRDEDDCGTFSYSPRKV